MKGWKEQPRGAWARILSEIPLRRSTAATPAARERDAQLVKDLVEKRVPACAEGDSLNEAARLMWDHELPSVAVVDKDRRLVGMLSERDVAMAAYLRGRSLRNIQVAQAMSRPVATLSPQDDARHARRLLHQHRIQALPVIEDGRFVGMLAASALGAGSAEDLELEAS